jgi:hypothetical protein
MRVKGRYLVVAWTVVFLAAVGVIVLRARSGFVVQRRVAELAAQIRALEGVRGDVEAKVASLKSRPVLAPKLEARGLRFASDTEFQLIQVPVAH